VLLAGGALPVLTDDVAGVGGRAVAAGGANLWAGLAHAGDAASNKGNADPATGNGIMPEATYWVGALVGLIICGMLAFVLFKLSIVMCTSVSGSTIAVMGLIALLLCVDPWRDSVSSGLTANKLVIPLLVFVPAIIGLIIHESNGFGAGAAEE